MKFMLWLTLNVLISGHCQTLTGQIVDKNPNMFLSRSNSLIPEAVPISHETGAVKMFLEDDWYIGDVNSFDGEFITNKPLKYEIIRNRLEMQINGEIMGLNQNHVKSFEWFNVKDNRRAIFLNCKGMSFKESQPIGFLEILSEGKITLSSHKTAITLEGHHPVIGSHKKDNITVKEEFYFSGEGGAITLLPKKRRNILKIFKDKKETIREFINWNDLTLKKKQDLIKVFNFYNSLSDH